MNIFYDIKAVIDDLNNRKSLLAEQMREFQILHGEIQRLVERSPNDPQARVKLEKLNQAFPEGIQNYQQAIISKVTLLEENFKQLQENFKATGDSDKASEEAIPKLKRKQYKNYM